MPQEHHVLRCFSCDTFQVHIVKKDKKWECKICGAKQSFKRNYGRGSGKDCRTLVMKLNELRMTKDDNPCVIDTEFCNDSQVTEERNSDYKYISNGEPNEIFSSKHNTLNKTNNVTEEHISENSNTVHSKWSKYLDEKEIEEHEVEDNCESDYEIIPQDKKRKIVKKQGQKTNYSRSKRFCQNTMPNNDISNEILAKQCSSNKKNFFLSSQNKKINSGNLSNLSNFAKSNKDKYLKYLDQ